MVRFLNTDKIDKETWLRARKKGITGTDAGAIAGMNPYKSSFSVYQEKVSEEVTEVEDNERMREEETWRHMWHSVSQKLPD